ncbi:hypothetical protein J4573_16745 [Actinomadura barringtoniae]|uniref:SnoaL-like domain-containing protein n=1 Tax=Actinomadura barringtoniae TaxID=1427535 RepID=A0A939PAB3_9ACTN|nr:hypothetical protein [Actinomadura barringtoniae]MBO2448753.1 hypothetical protein [Actinomadura barringtoniae]
MTSSVSETTVEQIQQFVADWYVALDRHVPYAEVVRYLDEDGIRFVFPETTVSTVDGLKQWYDTVTNRFFDEAHRVDRADVRFAGDVTGEAAADVHVVVNWQTSVWNPPEPRSARLEYESDQSWQVSIGADGRPRIRSYTVNNLVPQGDTPELF